MIIDDYLKLGWFLVPVYEIKDGHCSCGDKDCRSPGKHPRDGKGIKHASNKSAQIDAWLKRWPDCNWAVVCDLSGFITIDVDPRDDGDETFKELIERLGPLPHTPVQYTGGNGWHYLLKVPKGTKCRGKLGKGVDLKANGYILIEPSNHLSGGHYSWIQSPIDTPVGTTSEAWTKEIENRPPKPVNRPKPQPIPDDADELEEALNYLDAEDYELWVNCGMSLKAAMGDAGFQVWDRWSQKSAKYQSKGMQTKWNSFKREGYNKATIIWNAQKAGWRSSRRGSPNWKPSDGPPPHTDDEAPADIINIADHQDQEWTKGLRWVANQYGNQRLLKDAHNAALILCNHDDWKGCIVWDSFRNRMFWRRETPEVVGMQKPDGDYKDHHWLYVQQWIGAHYETGFSQDAIRSSLMAAAAKYTHHPVRSYLKSITWDQQLRINRWLIDYLGAEDTEANKLMGKMWLIAAIARVMKPGCRVNNMLILEGPQQIGKSTAVQIMAGDWYQEKIGDLRGKTAEENIQGFWIIEISELDAFRGAAATRIKSFISTLVDSFRPAYGHSVVDYPRQCICVGTTNETSYLHDSTGGMRFWPVRIKRLELEKLKDDRDQLWAEALHQYEQGVPWWPTPEQSKTFTAIQEDRYQEHPWEEQINRYLKRVEADEIPNITPDEVGTEVSQDQIFTHLDVEPKDRKDHRVKVIIGQILTRAGWKWHWRRLSGVRVKRYYKPLYKG